MFAVVHFHFINKPMAAQRLARPVPRELSLAGSIPRGSEGRSVYSSISLNHGPGRRTLIPWFLAVLEWIVVTTVTNR